MKDGNPEFSDLIYDFIKARYPSTSRRIVDMGVEIFIEDRWVCSVVHEKVYSYQFNYFATGGIAATDPQLFDKLIQLCGGHRR